MVKTGFDATLKLITGGSCACSSDVLTITGGTCTAIPYVTDFKLTPGRGTIPYTGFGDKLEKNIPGFPSYKASMNAGLDLSSTPQLGLWNGLSCSTPAAKVLRYADGNKTITMRGYLEGGDMGNAVGSKATMSINLGLTHLPKTC